MAHYSRTEGEGGTGGWRQRQAAFLCNRSRGVWCPISLAGRSRRYRVEEARGVGEGRNAISPRRRRTRRRGRGAGTSQRRKRRRATATPTAFKSTTGSLMFAKRKKDTKAAIS